jgi:hypothetical protein
MRVFDEQPAGMIARDLIQGLAFTQRVLLGHVVHRAED